MSLKKLPVLLILLTALSTSIYAQEDKLSYKFEYGKTSPQNGGAKFLQNNLTLRIPIKSGKGRFTIGPEIDLLNISSTASPADASALQTIGLGMGYQSRLGSKSIFSFHMEPMFASDFHVLSGNSFRFKSQALVLLNADRKFAFGFGLGYQYQFSGSQLIPLITTVWRISDNVTLSGLLPIIPRLEFKLNKKWSIGGGINGDYSSFRLTAFDNRYIQYQNWAFGITGKYKPSKRFEIGALLGTGTRHISIYKSDQTVPLRIYSWNIGGGSHTPEFDQKYKGVAANISLAYKL